MQQLVEPVVVSYSLMCNACEIRFKNIQIALPLYPGRTFKARSSRSSQVVSRYVYSAVANVRFKQCSVYFFAANKSTYAFRVRSFKHSFLNLISFFIILNKRNVIFEVHFLDDLKQTTVFCSVVI